MGSKIQDGRGTSNLAKVNNEGALSVTSIMQPEQHWESLKNGNAYQTWGTSTPTNGTTNCLYLEPDENNLNLVVTYIRLQMIHNGSGTEFPNSNNYFELVRNVNYSAGGSEAITCVTNLKYPNLVPIIAYQDNPTIISTNSVVMERYYPESNGKMQSFNKEGTIIVPKNKGLLIRYVGDHTGGVIYSRISYYLDNPEE